MPYAEYEIVYFRYNRLHFPLFVFLYLYLIKSNFIVYMADDKKTCLSFGFSKRTDAPKLKVSAINEGDVREDEGKDYLLSVEGRKINRF